MINKTVPDEVLKLCPPDENGIFVHKYWGKLDGVDVWGYYAEGGFCGAACVMYDGKKAWFVDASDTVTKLSKKDSEKNN